MTDSNEFGTGLSAVALKGLPSVNPTVGSTAPSDPSATATSTTPVVGQPLTTDANGNPVTQGDALAIISDELTQWGFGADAITWATQQITSNNSIDQIVYSLRQQPFYKSSIFGQVADQRSAAGLPAMTEAQILSYKDTVYGSAQQAGLPSSFITDAEIAQLAGHDVSASEVDARITQGYTAALKAPPDVLAQLNTYYGIDAGHLAAYYLDPTKALPILQQQFNTAQVGAEATRTGYGSLDQSTAAGLTQLGVTDAQAQAGFTKLGTESQLFNALPGSGEQGVNQQIQLAAEFGGNAEDQQAISKVAQQREAVFQGNFHFAESQGRGITGLGTVPRNG